MSSIRRGCRLLTFAATALVGFAAYADGEVIPFIKIAGNTYSNVTVRDTSDTTITLSHSKGMASINQAKVTRQELEDLGLIEKAPPPPPPKMKLNLLAPPAEGELSPATKGAASIAQVMEKAKQFQGFDSPGVQDAAARLGALPTGPFLVAVPAYLFICLCFLLICSKAGKPSPLLVWLPVLQMYPLYRAAKMSPVWFGLMVFTVVLELGWIAMIALQLVSPYVLLGIALVIVLLCLVHTIGSLIWCFKICTARGKSPALGIFMLLPGLNLLTLMYLAFSGGGEVPKMELIRLAPPPQREIAMAD